MGWRGPVTHRQHKAYLAWFTIEWNMPDRHDTYIMQLTATVHNMMAKTPVESNKFKMKFVPAPKEEANQDNIAAASKSVWMVAAGMRSDGTPLGPLQSNRPVPENIPKHLRKYVK
jgi:hypothetical protein